MFRAMIWLSEDGLRRVGVVALCAICKSPGHQRKIRCDYTTLDTLIGF